MGRGIAVSALLCTLLLQPAISIYAQEGPTNADLKPGYCLDVIKDKMSLIVSKSQGCGALTTAELQQLCQKTQSEIERLNDYLIARG